MGLFGCSVTQRIKQVRQPIGGYINPKTLTKEFLLKDGVFEFPKESAHPSLVGLAVDYLTRYMLGDSAEEAFKISLLGLEVCESAGMKEDAEYGRELLGRLSRDLNMTTVESAIKLCGFDVCMRVGMAGYKSITLINADLYTCSNVAIMVKRNLNLFKVYGAPVLNGFVFKGGYTFTVGSGDGDFVTPDTLWELKVSVREPTKEWTLQTLMYWRMGLHSEHREIFEKVKYLGIVNPRKNAVYRIAVANIPEKNIEAVERDVIGYRMS
jgi:hypothetical protein